MGTEERKDIEGYEGAYQVSRSGEVKGLPRRVYRRDGIKGAMLDERMLKGAINSSGYLTVTLSLNSKQNSRFIHRLVAEAFIENPNGCEQVNHKDRNKLNNHVENLEWVTPQENSAHGNSLESDKERKRGSSNPNSKLTEKCVIEIRRLRKKGIKIQEIADKFDINNSSVSTICNNKSWKHIIEREDG